MPNKQQPTQTTQSAPKLGLDSNEQEILTTIVDRDFNTLVEKSKTYGDSWKKRGGMDSWFMLCRKWDRLENMVQSEGPDQFNILVRASQMTEGDFDGPVPSDNTIFAQIQDLRRYLLLVEMEVRNRHRKGKVYDHYGTSHGEHPLKQD